VVKYINQWALHSKKKQLIHRLKILESAVKILVPQIDSTALIGRVVLPKSEKRDGEDVVEVDGVTFYLHYL
jgi:hypothetical protein